MNKAELIEALSARLGDKKSANAALDAVLAEIQATVTKGDKIAITGFGVFEKRVRAARTARNPRTGEAVKVKKTSVPTFRPGATFREMVASGKAPKKTVATAAKSTASARGTKSTAAKSTAAKSTAAKSTAAKTTAARSTKATAAKKAPAKTTRAATTSARKTTTATVAKAAPAKTTRARKTAAK